MLQLTGKGFWRFVDWQPNRVRMLARRFDHYLKNLKNGDIIVGACVSNRNRIGWGSILHRKLACGDENGAFGLDVDCLLHWLTIRE